MLSDLKLVTKESKLAFKRLFLSGREWVSYRKFNHNVLLDIDVSSGYLSSDDVAYFAPAMRSWGVRLYDLKLSGVGEVDALTVDVGNISYGEGSHISTQLKLSNASVLKSAYAEFDLGAFVVESSDAIELIDSIDEELLSESQREIIDKIERLSITGSAEGELDRVVFDGQLESGVGVVTSNLTLDLTQRGLFAFDGVVDIEGLDLGALFGSSYVGRVTAQSRVDGVMGRLSEQSLDVSSVINSIELEGYNLRDSRVELHMNSDDANFSFESDDPSLQMSLNGSVGDYTAMMQRSGGATTFQLNSTIEDVDLKRLGLNRRDDSSSLRANIELSGSGYDIDNIAGVLRVSDAEYRYDDQSLSTDLFTIDMRDAAHGRIFTLSSEFADVVMNLSGSPSENLKYLKNGLSEYLPALYDAPYSVEKLYAVEGMKSSSKRNTVASGSSNHLSLINIKLHNITPIAKAVGSDFEASVDTRGLLLFDPVNRAFTVTLNSSYIERNALLMIGLDAQLTNHGDSISLYSHADELYVGTTLMENSTIAAGANGNKISLNMGFLNKADSAAAHIVADMTLSREFKRGRELNIKLQPSRVSNATNEWDLSSQGIQISSGGVNFDNFVVKSRGQSLNINGRASNSLMDNLSLEMNNFDLSLLSTLVSRVGYQVGGYTNGRAVVASALHEARVEADLSLDSVTVNTIKSPDLRLLAQWDSQQNRARLHLLNRIDQDTLVRGSYIPSKVMYYARLHVDSVNLNLLDPPLGGVIHDTEGYANIDVVLSGERRKAQLDGQINCMQMATTIGYTGVRYTVDQGVVQVKNNTLEAKGLVVNDSASGGSGEGLLDLSVDLSRLNNIGYDLRVQPKQMLVLNTTQEQNQVFYGRVRASGLARIKGSRSGVEMDINAETNRDSKFFMPLNGSASISQADFITFAEPKVQIDTTNVIVRKRESFQRQQLASQERGNISLNLNLRVRPNTEVEVVIDPSMGGVIHATGDGNFDIRVEPKRGVFEFFGDYSITDGNYIFNLGNVVNKRFSISSGSSMQWSGDPLDATLDISAIYKLKTSLQPLLADESTRAVPVDCIINLSERLMHPEVSFGIELPSSDVEQQAVVANLLNDQESLSRQFFYLMLSNSFIPEVSGATSTDLGVTATAATGFELLANQLSNWLSTSKYNVVLRYRPESELTGEEVDFGFSRGWIDNRLLVELEGNYVSDNKQSLSEEDISNFMGEAYITWLIDPAGALRVRGFTQTVDRYDENQGLQETGVGLYYRENFENFKDLRQRVKARFAASPERKEKRAKRRDNADNANNADNADNELAQ